MTLKDFILVIDVLVLGALLLATIKIIKE